MISIDFRGEFYQSFPNKTSMLRRRRHLHDPIGFNLETLTIVVSGLRQPEDKKLLPCPELVPASAFQCKKAEAVSLWIWNTRVLIVLSMFLFYFSNCSLIFFYLSVFIYSLFCLFFKIRLRDDMLLADGNFDFSRSMKSLDSSSNNPSALYALHSKSCLTKDQSSLKVIKSYFCKIIIL